MGEGARRADEGQSDGICLAFRLCPMARQNPLTLTRARILRHSETEAEIRLWEYLRSRRLNGHKFVRQLPIDCFIADFACRSRKLIVEVDGATHGARHELAYDARRTGFLAGQGWRVVRVVNQHVFEDINAVCDYILLALEK